MTPDKTLEELSAQICCHLGHGQKADPHVTRLLQSANANADVLDMMRDEFQRIIALTHGEKSEIRGIAERAMREITRRVPLIAENDQLREIIADHKHLARELDVLLNGDSAAPQASLCDIVAQVRKYSERLQSVLSSKEPLEYIVLQGIENRALDNMEGEDLEGFNKWEKIAQLARDLHVSMRATDQTGRTKQDKHG